MNESEIDVPEVTTKPYDYRKHAPPNPWAYVSLSSYSVRMATPACRFWNETAQIWATDGCKVGIGMNSKWFILGCSRDGNVC